jgi:hypothetical protein
VQCSARQTEVGRSEAPDREPIPYPGPETPQCSLRRRLTFTQCGPLGQTSKSHFLPDPLPLAGLVYIMNFPSVCLSVPRENYIKWSDEKVYEKEVAIFFSCNAKNDFFFFFFKRWISQISQISQIRKVTIRWTKNHLFKYIFDANTQVWGNLAHLSFFHFLIRPLHH